MNASPTTTAPRIAEARTLNAGDTIVTEDGEHLAVSPEPGAVLDMGNLVAVWVEYRTANGGTQTQTVIYEYDESVARIDG